MGIETTNDGVSPSGTTPESEGSISQEETDAMMGPGGSVSQDEIDALMGFGGTAGDPSQEADSRAPEQDSGAVPPLPGTSEQSRGVASLDLLNQDRITRSRMPTMEVLNDRFARSFRVSLFNYLRVNADILPISAQLQRYGEYIGKIALPSYFVMVSMAPLRGSMLFVMDPYLCYAVIEAFFGGNGKLEPKIEGRDFSVIEQRVFNKIIDYATKRQSPTGNSGHREGFPRFCLSGVVHR